MASIEVREVTRGRRLMSGAPVPFRRQTLYPYLFIAPAIAFLCVFIVYPIVRLVALGFTEWNMIDPKPLFVGLRNYSILFRKREFLEAMSHTVVYTVFTVGVQLALAILVAVWLKPPTRFNAFSQAAIFTPHIISLVSVSMVWMWLMDPRTGVLNLVLNAFGLPSLKWLNSSDTAMMSIIMVSIWKGLGYHALVVLASLQAIPAEIYEAAALDNAGRTRVFFRITLPMISPQTFLLLITMTINSFKVFETIRIMTNGGPGNSTKVLVYYIYENAFTLMKLGYASAGGTVLLVIVAAITAVYFLVLSRRVHYQ